MEAVMALNEIDPAHETPSAGKKTRVRIDWKRGAALLVAGEAPDGVAAALGITQDRLWRHLRSSLRFQFLLRQARETQLLLGRLQLEAASNAAAIRCAQKAEKSPAGLFEQFKSASVPAWTQPSSVDGRDMVLRLADSLRRAPKRPPRVAKAPDKGEISKNKDAISENKTQANADKPAVSTAVDADKLLKDQAVMPQRPSAAPTPSSRIPPYGRVPGPQGGGTVQRTDVFGRPLPDVEMPAPDRHGRV
ncbi:MAG: hypothetical protein CTR53_11310 [Ferrovibrio sp.]|nr:MAG: hypothetical protein CTR53_11310 [Ferrovibrio sp.]